MAQSVYLLYILVDEEGIVSEVGNLPTSLNVHLASHLVFVFTLTHVSNEMTVAREEIFGPVLTVYVYEDGEFEEVLALCDEASPYALTGSIFASDEANIQKALDALRFTAGNFYINDKPTGAVVAQQPFGGARASGTNDKAGSPLNLLRWISPRTVKRTLDIPQDWTYPFMGGD